MKHHMEISTNTIWRTVGVMHEGIFSFMTSGLFITDRKGQVEYSFRKFNLTPVLLVVVLKLNLTPFLWLRF